MRTLLWAIAGVVATTVVVAAIMGLGALMAWIDHAVGIPGAAALLLCVVLGAIFGVLLGRDQCA